MSIMNRNRQQLITQSVQMHRENLRRNVQRRLEVARSTGNESLIRQLEAEASYIG
jgi:hypothetical protein